MWRKRNMNKEKEIWTKKKKYEQIKKKYEQIKRNINKEKNNLKQTKRIMFLWMNEKDVKKEGIYEKRIHRFFFLKKEAYND